MATCKQCVYVYFSSSLVIVSEVFEKVILDPIFLLFPNVATCPRAGLPLPAQLTLHSPCTAPADALPRIVIFTLKRMNATVKAVKTCRFVWKFQNCLSLRV